MSRPLPISPRDRVRDLEEENQELQDRLDAVAHLMNADDEQEDEEEDKDSYENGDYDGSEEDDEDDQD